MHLRVEVQIRPQPKANRVSLRMDLRMLTAAQKGEPREISTWENYAQEHRFIDPADRGSALRFALHGGATLPRDIEPGPYQMEVTVRDLGSGFRQTARGKFGVARRVPR